MNKCACMEISTRFFPNRLISQLQKKSFHKVNVASEQTEILLELMKIQEKCPKQNKGFYTSFVDLTKEFDTVNIKGKGKILRCLGCSLKFLI